MPQFTPRTAGRTLSPLVINIPNRNGNRRWPLQSRRLAGWLVALTTVGVLFCGMFPFDFVLHLGSAVQEIRHRFDTTVNQLFTAGDGLENVVFFMPTGFALAALMWIGPRSNWRRLTIAALAAVSIGAGLSTLVELTQVFLLSRDPSLADICSNTAGTAVGFVVFVGIGSAVMQALTGLLEKIDRLATFRNLFAAAGVWLLVGILLPLTRRDAGSLSGWSPAYSLIVGNETTGDRFWNGTIRSAALFDRALNDEEIDHLLTGTSADKIGAGLLSDYAFAGRGPYPDRAGHGATLHWMAGNAPAPGTIPPSLAGPAGLLQFGAPTGEGWWLNSEPGGEAAIAQRIAHTNAFTLDIEVQTDDLGQHDGPPRIISISGDTHRCDLQLLQEADALVIRLRTVASGDGGSDPEFVLPNVFEDIAPRRIVVTFNNGRLAVTTDHTGDRAAFHYIPEATLIWRVYPRDGWAFRLDSAGQSTCAKIYRLAVMFPVGLFAGWALLRSQRPRDIFTTPLPMIAFLTAMTVVFEAGITLEDGFHPDVLSVITTLLAGLIGLAVAKVNLSVRPQAGVA